VLALLGLGNPGSAYRNSRHNAGFLLLDRIVGGESIPDAVISRNGREAFRRFAHARSDPRRGLVAVEAEGELNGVSFVLVKPATFMNESGRAVASLMTRGVIRDLSELLVVVDDVDLPVGKIRLRPEGSAGGHNGLRSIIRHVGTNAFARLRIGVGPRPVGDEMVDHVLGSFRPEEYEQFNTTLDIAAQVAAAWITGGIVSAHNIISRLTATT
jgi:peptidyl-tRNA hydrolase, PTH1 family